MSNTDVAVVITFYRDDRFFPEALASVLAQTHEPAEVVVVDDASPDGSAQSLEGLPTGVRVVRQPHNQGAGAARQAGTDATRAPLVAYLDADDVWMPTKLARQVAQMADRTVAASHTGLVRFTASGHETPFLDKPTVLDLPTQLRRNQVMPSSLMVRRDALAAVGGWSPDRRLMEDWELSIRFAAAGCRVAFLAEPLVRFRRWGHGNLSSRGYRHMLTNLGTVRHHAARYRATLGVGGTAAVVGRVVHDEGCRRGGFTGALLRSAGRALGHRRQHVAGMHHSPASLSPPAPNP